MIIEPSLIAMLGGTLLTSSLVTSAAANIDKTYNYDKDAEKLAMAGAGVGFGGLLIALGGLLYAKLYPTTDRFLLGVFILIWLILVILLFLSYLAYDYLDKAYHYPVAAKYTLNKTERRLLFAAFCFSLISVTVGLCYVFTHGIESEFFDSITGGMLDIKGNLSKVFTRMKKENKERMMNDQMELENFLNDLNVN